DIRQLPGQVERVLDRGVGAQTVGRRVPVRGAFRQVGLEPHVGRGAEAGLSLHRYAGQLGRRRAPTVRADQIAGTDGLSLAALAVPDGRRDAVGILLEAYQL